MERKAGRKGVAILLVLGLCLVAPQPAVAGLPQFTVAGSALQLTERLRLTPPNHFTAGAAWLPERRDVAGGFTATFEFRLTDCVHSCADGFAFVVQNVDASQLGLDGGRLGYHSIPNSVAVEFDTYLNGPDFNDPNSNHVSVHTRGTAPNDAHEQYSRGATVDPGPLSDGNPHTARVVYAPGALSVHVDDLSTPILTVPLDLESTLDLDAGRAFVGFTAGTGADAQAHDILSFSFSGGNAAPECSGVTATPGTLWPPNRRLERITLGGATDPDGDPTTLAVTGVTHDEPGRGNGDRPPDVLAGAAPHEVLLRAERGGGGDGRLYRISFTVSDGHGGECSGAVGVAVPRSRRGAR